LIETPNAECKRALSHHCWGRSRCIDGRDFQGLFSAKRTVLGQATLLSGSVSDARGQALRNAVVDIWQCDHQGRYRHPRDGRRVDAAFQGFGRVLTDEQGRYRFRTIRPMAYSGRTPHIHVKVSLGRRELLTTQLYVQGEAGNARDGLYRSLNEAERSALTVAFQPGAQGLTAAFAIVVAA
jgi:protocatechuate 3,4-dioxygenase, beta subunit